MALALGGTSAVVVGLASASAGPPQPPAAPAAPPAAAPATTAPATPPAAAPEAPAQAGPAPAQDLDVPTLPRSEPVSLRIPSIGIDTGPLVDLATEADGTLEVPADEAQAGWFSPGPAPGQFGPAVIAGHVDGNSRPGVFYRLGELRPGAEVQVTRADGTLARFVVDKVERFPKDEFPTARVYGDQNHRAELRLITCGGEFDDSTGHYVDNVVAYAHLI